MKKYETLAKAPKGFYFVKLPGKSWDVGYLERHPKCSPGFCFTPMGYFGGGQFALEHEVLKGAMFCGPIPEPAE